MDVFPWLPIGHNLADGKVGYVRLTGDGFQIVADQVSNKVVVLLEEGSLVGKASHHLLRGKCSFRSCSFGGKSYLYCLIDKDFEPYLLGNWNSVRGLPTSSEILDLGGSIQRLRSAYPNAELGRALYFPGLGECLPIAETDEKEDLQLLAMKILAAGSKARLVSPHSVRKINSWLTNEEIGEFCSALGISFQSKKSPKLIDPEAFTLPGRPKLERFLREYILEPLADRERYAAMGVKAPNGLLLYGPPGTGKSHAVRKLKAALGWPSFDIALGSMGSPFVHQTSVAIRRTFEEAAHCAPALVILEELDALAVSRGPFTQDHKVEEVAELLNIVERASESKVLVIATTNQADRLDAALLRKGRFDHMVEVDYPSSDEVVAVLEASLSERPHRDMPNLSDIAMKLAGRPISDVAWVVNESARLAARAKKSAIDEIDLLSALKRLEAK